MKNENIIPEQEKGARTDTSEEVRFETSNEAAQFFEIAKTRLLSISNWDNICGKASAKFQLTDSSGNEIKRSPEKDDHIKINIPAPGNDSGSGHDWVQIEQIEEKIGLEYKLIAIKVRPATNPENDNTDTAHFFKDDATSTFLVEQTGSTVKAEVHGRNETPNTESEGIMDTVRNAIVAVGAMIGISTPQWKSLVKGLVSQKTD